MTGHRVEQTSLSYPRESSATISEDGLYRYSLVRAWGPGAKANFLMLNPSTADARQDDPTIRRCMGFAVSWGCDGLVVTNLFAYRSTYPPALAAVDDPVGPGNGAAIMEAAASCFPVVAAWGAAPVARDRAQIVLKALATIPFVVVYCLGLTKGGQPRHPLYVPRTQPRVVFMKEW